MTEMKEICNQRLETFENSLQITFDPPFSENEETLYSRLLKLPGSRPVRTRKGAMKVKGDDGRERVVFKRIIKFPLYLKEKIEMICNGEEVKIPKFSNLLLLSWIPRNIPSTSDEYQEYEQFLLKKLNEFGGKQFKNDGERQQFIFPVPKNQDVLSFSQEIKLSILPYFSHDKTIISPKKTVTVQDSSIQNYIKYLGGVEFDKNTYYFNPELEKDIISVMFGKEFENPVYVELEENVAQINSDTIQRDSEGRINYRPLLKKKDGEVVEEKLVPVRVGHYHLLLELPTYEDKGMKYNRVYIPQVGNAREHYDPLSANTIYFHEPRGLPPYPNRTFLVDYPDVRQNKNLSKVLKMLGGVRYTDFQLLQNLENVDQNKYRFLGGHGRISFYFHPKMRRAVEMLLKQKYDHPEFYQVLKQYVLDPPSPILSDKRVKRTQYTDIETSLRFKKKVELERELKKLGASIEGKKEDLIQRLAILLYQKAEAPISKPSPFSKPKKKEEDDYIEIGDDTDDEDEYIEIGDDTDDEDEDSDPEAEETVYPDEEEIQEKKEIEEEKTTYIEKEQEEEKDVNKYYEELAKLEKKKVRPVFEKWNPDGTRLRRYEIKIPGRGVMVKESLYDPSLQSKEYYYPLEKSEDFFPERKLIPYHVSEELKSLYQETQSLESQISSYDRNLQTFQQAIDNLLQTKKDLENVESDSGSDTDDEGLFTLNKEAEARYDESIENYQQKIIMVEEKKQKAEIRLVEVKTKLQEIAEKQFKWRGMKTDKTHLRRIAKEIERIHTERDKFVDIPRELTDQVIGTIQTRQEELKQLQDGGAKKQYHQISKKLSKRGMKTKEVNMVKKEIETFLSSLSPFLPEISSYLKSNEYVNAMKKFTKGGSFAIQKKIQKEFLPSLMKLQIGNENVDLVISQYRAQKAFERTFNFLQADLFKYVGMYRKLNYEISTEKNEERKQQKGKERENVMIKAYQLLDSLKSLLVTQNEIDDSVFESIHQTRLQLLDISRSIDETDLKDKEIRKKRKDFLLKKNNDENEEDDDVNPVERIVNDLRFIIDENTKTETSRFLSSKIERLSSQFVEKTHEDYTDLVTSVYTEIDDVLQDKTNPFPNEISEFLTNFMDRYPLVRDETQPEKSDLKLSKLVKLFNQVQQIYLHIGQRVLTNFVLKTEPFENLKNYISNIREADETNKTSINFFSIKPTQFEPLGPYVTSQTFLDDIDRLSGLEKKTNRLTFEQKTLILNDKIQNYELTLNNLIENSEKFSFNELLSELSNKLQSISQSIKRIEEEHQETQILSFLEFRTRLNMFRGVQVKNHRIPFLQFKEDEIDMIVEKNKKVNELSSIVSFTQKKLELEMNLAISRYSGYKNMTEENVKSFISSVIQYILSVNKRNVTVGEFIIHIGKLLFLFEIDGKTVFHSDLYSGKIDVYEIFDTQIEHLLPEFSYNIQNGNWNVQYLKDQISIKSEEFLNDFLIGDSSRRVGITTNVSKPFPKQVSKKMCENQQDIQKLEDGELVLYFDRGFSTFYCFKETELLSLILEAMKTQTSDKLIVLHPTNNTPLDSEFVEKYRTRISSLNSLIETIRQMLGELKNDELNSEFKEISKTRNYYQYEQFQQKVSKQYQYKKHLDQIRKILDENDNQHDIQLISTIYNKYQGESEKLQNKLPNISQDLKRLEALQNELADIELRAKDDDEKYQQTKIDLQEQIDQLDSETNIFERQEEYQEVLSEITDLRRKEKEEVEQLQKEGKFKNNVLRPEILFSIAERMKSGDIEIEEAKSLLNALQK